MPQLSSLLETKDEWIVDSITSPKVYICSICEHMQDKISKKTAKKRKKEEVVLSEYGVEEKLSKI